MSKNRKKMEPSQTTLWRLADAVGHDLKPTNGVVEAKAVDLGDGVVLQLDMRFSHAMDGHDFYLICWRALGDLYLTACHEMSHDTTTVLAIDKAKLKDKIGKSNFATFMLGHDEKVNSLDDYILLVADGLVSGSFRRGDNGDWKKLEV